MGRSRATLEEESRRAQRRVRRVLVGLSLTVVLAPVLMSFVFASWRRKIDPVAELPPAPSPAVTTRPMPPGLLPGQRPAKKGCPPGCVELDGHPGCWMRIYDAPLGCGVFFLWRGGCYAAYIEVPSLPSAQDPWWKDAR